MIQRVQTLHLLAALALLLTAMLSPIAQFVNAEGIYTLGAMGIKNIDGEVIYSTIYLALMMGITTALPLVNILLFKNRMLQIRLCVVEIILIVGSLVVMGVYYHLGSRALGMDSSSIRVVAALPIAAILFVYLALKAILRDELLIKSLDRIR